MHSGFSQLVFKAKKKRWKNFSSPRKKSWRKPFFFLFSPSPDVTLLMPPPSKSVQGGDFIPPPPRAFFESFSDSKILGFQRREGQKRAFVYCVLDLPTRICVPHLTFPPLPTKEDTAADLFFRPVGTKKAFKNCPLAMREMAGRCLRGFAAGSWNG